MFLIRVMLCSNINMSNFSNVVIESLIASAWVEDSVKSSHPVTIYKVAFAHHVYCRFISLSLPALKFGSEQSSEWSCQLPRDVGKKIHMIVWNQIHGRTIQNDPKCAFHSCAFEIFQPIQSWLLFLGFFETLQEFVENLDTNSGWPSFQHKTPWNHVIQHHFKQAQSLSTKSRSSHKGSGFQRGCIMARILIALLQLSLAKRLRWY